MRHARVVEFIVEQLGAHGVTHIFGVDGANIEDLFDAAYFRPEITTVLAKHEFSAATMADAYGRCGPTIGVVAATSGGGCLNLVPGLGESLASRVPVLALVGQAPTTTDGLGSFQDTSGRNGALDAVALFGAVSVYCRRVTTPAAILDALPEALAAARCGGPAVLLLPKDIQQAEIEIRDVRRVPDRAAGRVPRIAPGSPIVAALTSGPVTIVAGEQVARDDARAELERLRTALQAHIACVPDAKDVATPAASLAGTMGHPATAAAVRDSAVCLLVGTRMPLTGRGGLEDALEHTEVVSIGSSEPYVSATHLHSDDLRISLQALVTALEAPGRPGAVRPERWTELAPPACGHAGVRYRDIMRALDEALPDDTDIVVDAGNTGAAAVHHLPHRRGGRFVVALGMGGMGYSFGAAVGVACARGNRTVVIAGDGSFYMHGLELHTRHSAPPADHLCAAEQQCARDVRDARTALLRERAQLQQIRPQPARRRSGRDVPRAAGDRCRRTGAATRCPDLSAVALGARRRQHRMLGRRDPAVRTVSGRSRPRGRQSHHGPRGGPRPCPCQRLTISSPIAGALIPSRV